MTTSSSSIFTGDGSPCSAARLLLPTGHRSFSAWIGQIRASTNSRTSLAATSSTVVRTTAPLTTAAYAGSDDVPVQQDSVVNNRHRHDNRHPPALRTTPAVDRQSSRPTVVQPLSTCPLSDLSNPYPCRPSYRLTVHRTTTDRRHHRTRPPAPVRPHPYTRRTDHRRHRTVRPLSTVQLSNQQPLPTNIIPSTCQPICTALPDRHRLYHTTDTAFQRAPDIILLDDLT